MCPMNPHPYPCYLDSTWIVDLLLHPCWILSPFNAALCSPRFLNPTLLRTYQEPPEQTRGWESGPSALCGAWVLAGSVHAQTTFSRSKQGQNPQRLKPSQGLEGPAGPTQECQGQVHNWLGDITGDHP